MDFESSSLFGDDFTLFHEDSGFNHISPMVSLPSSPALMLTNEIQKPPAKGILSIGTESIESMQEELDLKRTRLARKAELARISRIAKKNTISQLSEENNILKNAIFSMNESLEQSRRDFDDFKSAQMQNNFRQTQDEITPTTTQRQRQIHLADKKTIELKQLCARMKDLKENSLLHDFMIWLFHFPVDHEFYKCSTSLFQSVIIKELLDEETAKNIFKIAHGEADQEMSAQTFSIILRNVSDEQFQRLNTWVETFGKVCMKIR